MSSYGERCRHNRPIEDCAECADYEAKWSTPWENPDGSTNVEGFLRAYERDDNTFWQVETGHIQNVLDALIEERKP